MNFSRSIPFLLVAGITGPVQFAVITAIAGSVRPGYSPVVDAVSVLGIGSTAAVENFSLVVLGVCLVAFAIGFARLLVAFLPPRRSAVSGVLLALPGIGVAVAGLVPLDSPVAVLHWAVGAPLTFLTPPITLILIGRWLTRVLPPIVGQLTIAAGFTIAVLVIGMFAVFSPESPLSYLAVGGLVERLVFAVLLAWYGLIAVQLLLSQTNNALLRPTKNRLEV